VLELEKKVDALEKDIFQCTSPFEGGGDNASRAVIVTGTTIGIRVLEIIHSPEPPYLILFHFLTTM